jgi:hypothetical protein
MHRCAAVLILAIACSACSSGGSSTPTSTPTSTATASAQSYTCPAATTSSGTLNCTALTLGDNKYSTTAPAVGTVFACSIPNGSGATGTPPWINSGGTTWNALTKVVVSGSVAWSGTFSASTSGSATNITGNGLPLSPITTGTYPIATTDPAYAYDQNPNHIAAQSISYALPYPPVAAASPTCVPMGRIGMALNGVSFYNALDAAGHDAGAHEEQDACHGHPDQSSTYHYHGWLQVCVTDAGSATQNSSLLGYALDGYGIYGPWYNGKVLTTSDLDLCHGTTSVVNWQGAQTNIYHYVSTYDYPYTVSCFHGTAVHQ